MARKHFTAEQIIKKLREAEILQSKGGTVEQICRSLGVSDVTYYRWRKEYGGMQVEQARRLKDLEQENTRLKKLVADLSLDNSILKEVSKGNF
jgi:transposase-like protein